MTEHKDIPSKWSVSLQVNPSLSQSETINGLHFEVSNGKTPVSIIYETASNDELLPNRAEEFEYAEKTMALKYVESVRNLMLARMVYQRLATPLIVEIVSGPSLINRDELSSAGLLRMKTLRVSFPIGLVILDVGDTLSDSNGFWTNGFQSVSAGFQNDVLRIADWLQRAKAERDPVKKFILAWIAFNGLFGHYASILKLGSNDEPSKFDLVIENLLTPGANDIVRNYDRSLNSMETYGITSKNGKRNFSLELKVNRQNTTNFVDILKSAVRCVYGVRKEIFHEAPVTEDIEKRAAQCNEFLIFLSLTALRNFVLA